ncbi:MAG: hypothetical protein AAFN05_10170, partial [Pseudomonadota bacterium]
MSASVTIRPLERRDEAAWRRLWTGYLEFYGTSVSEEVYATYFERLLGDDPQDFHCLVAETADGLIALSTEAFAGPGDPDQKIL